MLEFKPDTHTYLLDGIVIPSVSEILRFASREIYGDTSAQAMEIAADRGTRVHEAAEALDRSRSANVDYDIEPYVRAYTKFLFEHEVKWEKIEEPVVNEAEWYAGTLDRYGIVDGNLVLLDIKTTRTITARHKRLYAAQLTAYGKATPMLVDKLMILQLKNNETYELMEVEPEAEIWQGCLALHKAFTTKRRKK